MKFSLAAVLLSLFSFSIAQSPPRTDVMERVVESDIRKASMEFSDLSGISFRSVGPTVMSGRVVDIDVNPADPTHFFVAYASGGLWETHNNGHSFRPLFDSEAVMTIGDIAVYWPDTSIWIGTGEVNSSRSSYAGLGMYHSTDKGNTWTHKGLAGTDHIGRVLIHPSNPDELWVASLGPLYSEGGLKGVFHSHDAGKTWEQTFDTTVGVVDLIMHPEDPSVLYAAAWDRSRKAWNFVGNGTKSGIYQSSDGGHSWALLSTADYGFPQGEGVGRIGLDMTVQDGVSYLYALLDNQARRPKEASDVEPEKLQRRQFKEMDKMVFLALDESELADFLTSNGFPKKYSVAFLKENIESGEYAPHDIYDFLSDANTDLFDTPVIGSEVYRFHEEDNTWSKTHAGYIDDHVYSYGYYFGLIRVRPGDSQHLYLGGVPLIHSTDGGATWKSINPSNVHLDHHALWINPDKPEHLINGNDGGINISYDNGAHYVNCNSPAVGQFYTVAVDNAEPYNIYGGLQDNGVWRGPSTYEASDSWLQEGDYPYKRLMGGDGMQIEVDPRDIETVYTGYQFGHYYRIKKGEQTLHIHPSHELGERPLRWNWQTPIHLSDHNPDVLYMGSNRVHRSLDQGEHWEAISDDLTDGGIAGNVPYGTITTIDESPLSFGQIIAGTDDGHVWIKTVDSPWTDVGQNIADVPKGLWVSRVIASAHDKERFYASFNGYRADHLQNYVYRTDDGGASWEQLKDFSLVETVNVVLEDPVDEDILYVGTDHGLFTSLDGGRTFKSMMQGIPHVPVHDMVLQTREDELVVGTHGRSIYVADISKLRAIKELSVFPHLFALDSLSGADDWGESGWSQWFGFIEPELEIRWYGNGTEPCELSVKNEEGLSYFSQEIEKPNGLNMFTYDLTYSAIKTKRGKEMELPDTASNGKRYLPAGSYEVLLTCPTAKASQTLTIRK